ncbi:hypothetical protein A3K93_09125 [Acinetobacter sp. NCu2D-2]|uniref:DUF6160 family protein n=1 Tax=Acinetobacter sp. NCu2D-2 TaxID=1608473 RepID=UPI0007CDFFF6|nr:DUF6160 family protein [Acinetobacter sp. NCu2D-2]ANF82335.1 hypothetical protein A3K93_09125 [Acinetobacter sp. NCu2D-2]
MKTTIKLNLLTACLLLAQQSYALQLLQEKELSHITGQDGITINHQIQGAIVKDDHGKITSESPAATIDKLNWYDPNGSQITKNGMGLHNVNIYGLDGQAINSKLELDVGTTAYGTGIGMSFTVSPFKLNSKLNLVEVECTGGAICKQHTNNIRLDGDYKEYSMGGLEISTAVPFQLVLQTTSGLFNKNAPGYINFNLSNASIKHTMGDYGLALDNFNFNFSGTGYIYIDPVEGIVLTSNNGSTENTRYINLTPTPVLDANGEATQAHAAGVNFDLRYHHKDADEKTTVKNIMRYGISGSVKDARLSLGATQGGDGLPLRQTALNAFDITNGKDKNALSQLETVNNGYGQESGGLHLNLSAAFVNETEASKNQDLTATTLELGHTGKDSYAIQFRDLRTLTGQKSAYIDFGDIYINTIKANNLEFKINNKIREVLGYSDEYTVTQTLVGHHNASANNVALIAIRAMDFQAIAGSANFISNDNGDSTSSGNWGIGIPIYNLNANIALSGTTVNNQQALAYNVIASTDGYGIDKVTNSPSTTSILIIDGDNNYYAGLRNIDAFFESNGTISYEERGIKIIANKLLFAADAELAIGKLPSTENPDSNFDFTDREDVLTNIAFKLDGSGNLLIIPGLEDSNDTSKEKNFLSFEADFIFRPLNDTPTDEKNLGSYFSLSNIDSDGINEEVSSVMIKEIQGHLGLASKIQVKKDTVVLDNQIKFNYTNDLSNVFRANLAMQTDSNIHNMANLAITGGTLRSTLGIKPR